ncbi:hypothetical protein C0033_26685, partial [Clostridium sp. chh4-2]|uniref:hypothetical protein n=1 Tax=Clostridium sp. chh4-2 TaxID=2067550 RepID=UPI000CCF62DA
SNLWKVKKFEYRLTINTASTPSGWYSNYIDLDIQADFPTTICYPIVIGVYLISDWTKMGYWNNPCTSGMPYRILFNTPVSGQFVVMGYYFYK